MAPPVPCCVGPPDRCGGVCAGDGCRQIPERDVRVRRGRANAWPGRARARVGMFSPRETMPETAWAWVDSAVAWALGGAASGRRAVLVAGSLTPSADDRVLVERMRRLGLDVRIVDHTTEPDLRASPDLFVISESVHPDRVAGRFRDVPVPVIVMKAFVYDRMGMVQPAPASWHGNAMMIADGNWSDRLGYHVYFTGPGDYMLWLLGRDGGDAGADEVKVFFDTEQIDSGADDFFELRLPREPGWSNVAHVRRPDNRKTPAAPLLRVNRAGWHTLWLVKGAEPETHSAELPVTRRYPNWRVDKMVLFRDASREPAGDGPPETRYDGTVAVPRQLQHPSTAPGELYVLDGRFLIVEAEDLRPHAHWRLLREPAGFTGDGYLEWNGPTRSRNIEGVGGSDDVFHTQQGPLEEWLILRLRVQEPGDYLVNLRNYHRRADGDNDAWIGVVEPGFPRRPVKRVGDSLRDGAGFSWLDWGTPTLHLTAGEHMLYVGGRSRGFGVDRIAIYRADSVAARRQALDAATPAARAR